MTHSYAHIYCLLDLWIIPVCFIHLCCHMNVLSRCLAIALSFKPTLFTCLLMYIYTRMNVDHKLFQWVCSQIISSLPLSIKLIAESLCIFPQGQRDLIRYSI